MLSLRPALVALTLALLTLPAVAQEPAPETSETQIPETQSPETQGSETQEPAPKAAESEEAAEPSRGSSTSRPQEVFSTAIDVRLAELYVTVTDRDGLPVKGLSAEQFTVRENGQRQQLTSAIDAADLPLTLGLAVDSSASMFVKLPSVVSAARSLVLGLEEGRDRSFLVAFGPEPRVAAATTADLDRVSMALRNLEPAGSTPLWGSVEMALDEMRGVLGKRAIIVFFDGADHDGNDAFRRALRLAEQTKVAVYFVIMNNEAARTGGREFQTRSFISKLERIAAQGGGDVYFLPTDADLEPIYRRIENRLRSYYLLTYQPTVPLEKGKQRAVEVEVRRRGVSVGTIAGYKPETGS